MALFSSLIKSKDPEQKKLETKISVQAWKISKAYVSGRLRKKDIDDLENLYKEYFKRYPDAEREQSSRKRIAKLRKITE